jgi:hypothetical protein
MRLRTIAQTAVGYSSAKKLTKKMDVGVEVLKKENIKTALI